MRLAGAAALAAILLAACGPVAAHRGDAHEGPIRIVAQALPLDPADPARDHIGNFRFAGALQLTSPGTGLFGGFSDLKMTGDGHLTSESDEGSLLTAHVVLGPDGRLTGIDQARIVRLKGEDGRPLDGKKDADAEGVAVWPNGDLMVSFERRHRIWLYPAGGGRPRAVPMPPVEMPSNQGMEALALAPSQGADAYWVGIEDGQLWLCRLTSRCYKAQGQLPPPPGWRLPALFELDDGDLVVEHHHWDPVTGTHVRIAVIENPVTHLRPGYRDVLEIGPSMTIDNIEGVAVTKRPDGTRRFWLISDDNFAKKDQRTLLMAFDWTPPADGAAAKP
ncbi:MAG TPA: esterase-like activity of phytase family protein [Caulobacteraceae bacterium]|nr:esterase-like activity of phytase family protein [Caulobacteraceae bacterium]